MTRIIRLAVLFVAFLMVAVVQQSFSEPPSRASVKATFKSSGGRVIELDTQSGLLVSPLSKNTHLENCSDQSQVCLADNHGFAFAYFRKCSDAGSGDYKSLRFRPKIVSVVHGTDLWMVFDASPGYLFHYAYDRGIVGIYVGSTASYDFRDVLRNHNFRINDIAAMEYRIAPSADAVLPCSE